ncbi:hypothetical protein [Thermoflavifilum thermophilum]|uniref:Lipocalin-like domain-containing protein n=1 Tax=Thermoflavifilum thermophilum TaxID=1393122 RepID=A0A1I7NHU7_9BACT|nr:hypothetical protein [Thermoflavifilum thermophilum]SFV34214.1 hypothetical protein SAMN05660895_1935 [Thermoflavifilum thermophilum]
MKIMLQQQVLLLLGFALITGIMGCGKAHTRKLLLHKTWHVINVTPPENGSFDIEATRAAEEMKNGFYKNASFTFLDNGLFFTDFNGKTDTGRYEINPGGKIISLYPLHGNKIYEQIRIRELNDSILSFTTVMANFDMMLHLKAY